MWARTSPSVDINNTFHYAVCVWCFLTGEKGHEAEIAVLYTGNYFGEIALMVRQ